MKRKIAHLAGSLAGLASLGAAALAHVGDVSVSVNLATPGLYGQIVLGDVPAPELIMPRPVVAVPARVVVGVAPPPPPEPLYLHVPPGHEKHWAKHCREYDACGRPVYFVSERWYHDVYTPQHRMHEEHRMREEHREIERERIEHEEHVDHVRYEHEHGHDRDHDHHDRGHHDRDDHDGR